MEELFSIQVTITGCHSVQGPWGQVNQVLFEGGCDCDFFHGVILPGGVDTQVFPKDAPGRLSARYILEGRDGQGTPTRIFIENEGTYAPDGTCVTRPTLYTDNEALSWLQTLPLTGRITGVESGVIIHFSPSTK